MANETFIKIIYPFYFSERWLSYLSDKYPSHATAVGLIISIVAVFITLYVFLFTLPNYLKPKKDPINIRHVHVIITLPIVALIAFYAVLYAVIIVWQLKLPPSDAPNLLSRTNETGILMAEFSKANHNIIILNETGNLKLLGGGVFEAATLFNISMGITPQEFVQSSDGKLILVWWDDYVSFVDLSDKKLNQGFRFGLQSEDKKKRPTMLHDQVTSADISPDSKYIAVSLLWGPTVIVDVNARVIHSRIKNVAPGRYTKIRYSDNGKSLVSVTTSAISFNLEGKSAITTENVLHAVKIRLDVDDMDVVSRSGLERKISADVSSNGDVGVYENQEGRLAFFNFTSKAYSDKVQDERAWQLSGGYGVSTDILGFSDDATMFATSALDGAIVIWDVQSATVNNVIKSRCSRVKNGRFSNDVRNLSS